ncbi:hypothetical protein BDV23DRAFT_154241 [Aspergillus alliaceus]|uniref:Uncharacterized protein n=1 Tax=Petromyces alliaceus TaxID=209559 RepID=A0A5N7C9Z2_PETAA|nr:hypothetical protein BDV23DRAFT_154241 [Aspergillus alliaceus]
MEPKLRSRGTAAFRWPFPLWVGNGVGACLIVISKYNEKIDNLQMGLRDRYGR